MRTFTLVLGLTLAASPAHAQFGRLNDLANKASKVKRVADIRVSSAEEQQIGQQVSDRIVETFGVFQDPAVTKYVTLVGSVLAQASPRPELPWQFVVLDTDGVNAFAAPGGYVHITRGLLGLMKNEAELAGVLAHEIVHVTEKHTIDAIQKSDALSVASEEYGSGGMAQSLVTKIANQAYDDILDNKFSRDDEKESDGKGVEIANKVGYAPAGLRDALEKLAARNAGRTEPSGLFASHPALKERIAAIDRVIRDRKLTAAATAATRYTTHITFEVKPIDAIALVPEGSRGLAGGEEKKAGEPAKKEEEKKKSSGGGLLGRLTGGGGKQAQQQQTVASSGARGVNPDRDAVGGTNTSRVKVTLTSAEIAEFRKGIA